MSICKRGSGFMLVLMLACSGGRESVDIMDENIPDVGVADRDVRSDSDACDACGDDAFRDTDVSADIVETVDAEPDTNVYHRCGVDEFGVDHGGCDEGMSCEDGRCMFIDLPMCQENTCVDDGAGGFCECYDGYTCVDSVCIDMGDSPYCEGRECGDDGVGGLCGWCMEGQVCDQINGQCVGDCTFPDDLPVSWGRSFVLASFSMPGAADSPAECFDYTGDGIGDNSLTGLAIQVNSASEDLDSWATTVAMEFQTDDSSLTESPVDIAILKVTSPGQDENQIMVLPDSWNPETCHPYAFFPEADSADGTFAGHAAEIIFYMNVSPSFPLPVRMVDARISGTVSGDGPEAGVSDGVLTAVLLKDDWARSMDLLRDECAGESPPQDLESICEYVGVSGNPSIVFTLHRNDDGTYVYRDSDIVGNAAAFCMRFTAVEATISGYL